MRPDDPNRYAGSRRQFERAGRTLAGGVSTAFRALQEPVPISFDRGSGSRLIDIDGNQYVDYALGFGPMFLGHHPDEVINAVTAQLARGLGYGACHDLEAELAEAICRVVPSAEMCVLSNTGSEAVQVALRLARVSTGRNNVVKFRGHYHGWSDGIHVGVPGHLDGPGTGGQDPAAAMSTIVCDWNDVLALEAVLDDSIAAVIMEPVAINGGCFVPAPGYLDRVRELTSRNGSLLIFDEVITGFRVALGGAQALYGVMPDLTILGKALGAGFPISSVCGRRDVFEVVSSRRMAHVGTFNGNPVCCAAAVAALNVLERDAPEIYPRSTAQMNELAAALVEEASEHGIAITVNHVGAAGHAFASPTPVTNPPEADRADAALYRHFAAALLDEGIHVIPRGLLYVSAAHSDSDLAATREAIARAAARLAATHVA
jgi:glutamate-1-semialdehyde 2,1-aminomutase